MMLAERLRRGPRPKTQPLEAPYLIAEAGVNHENDIELAKRMIAEAAEAGADAIKFQTYKADTLAARNSPAYWDLNEEPTKSQYELFRKHDRFWKNDYEALKRECDREGIEFLSTPFDRESASFLNDLMSVFKIASADITNKPFIQYVCGFGKPMVLSTGASDLEEIQTAVSWIDSCGGTVSLLHCVLNYPTEEKNAYLGRITALHRHFADRVIGYSDHTLPRDMKTLEVAWLLGAEIIEKHFTFDKTLKGNDHYHAMDAQDVAVFRQLVSRALQLYGEDHLEALEIESTARVNARRSLVAARDIPAGETITADMLIPKRPGTGISPAEVDRVVGSAAATHIPVDTVLEWDLLS